MIRCSSDRPASDGAFLSRSLPTIAALLAVVYAVLAAAHLIVLTPEQSQVMSTVALASSVMMGVIAWCAARSRSSRALSWDAVAIATIALVNSAVHLAVVREPHHSINLLVLGLCAGFFLTETTGFFAISALCFLSWFLISATWVPQTDWVHFGFAWFVVTTLSMLAHYVQLSSRRYVRELLRAQKSTHQRLQNSLRDAGREILERRAAGRQLRGSEARKSAVLEAATDAIIEVELDGRIKEINQVTTDLLGFERAELIGQPLGEVIVPKRYRARHSAGLKAFGGTRSARILGQPLRLDALNRAGSEIPVEVVVQPVVVERETLGFVGFLRDVRKQLEFEEAQQAAKEAAERSSRAKSALLANVSHELRTPMSAVLGMTELVLQTELSASQRQLLSRSVSAGENLLGMVDELLDLAKIEAGHHDLIQEEFDLIEVIERLVASMSLAAEAKGLQVSLLLSQEMPTRVVGDAMRLRQVIENLVGNSIKFTEAGFVEVEVEAEQAEGDLRCIRITVSDTGPGIEGQDVERVFEPFEQVAPEQRIGTLQGVGLGLAIASRCVEQVAGRWERAAQLSYEDREGGGSRFEFPWYVQTSESVVEESRKMPARAVVAGKETRALESLCAQLTGLGVECDLLREVPSRIQPGTELLILDQSSIGIREEAQRGCFSEVENVVLLVPMSELGSERLYPCKVIPMGVPLSARTLLRRIREAEDVASAREPVVVDSIRILVVDDDESSRIFTGEALRRAGHEVVVADSGRAGLREFQQASFDLVLADLRMPGMSGLEALVEMRRIVGGESCAFRIMTAYAGDAERAITAKAELGALISKPLRVSKLKSLVECVARDKMERGVDFQDLLRDHFDGDLNLFSSVLEALTGSSKQDLDALDEALEASSVERARQLCHKLAGGLGEFAAMVSLRELDGLRGILGAESFDRDAARRSFEELGVRIEQEVSEIHRWLDRQRP